MRKLPLAVVGLLILVLTASLALAQASTSTTNSRVPVVDEVVFNPCNGELVTLNGSIHTVSHLTIDSNSGVHLEIHTNYQGLTGVGQNGQTYHGSGTNHTSLHFAVGTAFQTTVDESFRLIGHASTGNVAARNKLHLTINSSGDVTAFVSDFKLDCN